MNGTATCEDALHNTCQKRRVPDLEALNQYIAEVRDRPFQWHVNDCFIFTNNAYRSMYGEGWADDWADKYTKDGLYLKRDELRKVFKAKTLAQAIDGKLKRIGYVPPRGALVTSATARRWVIGEALGISIGTKALFLGKHGVVTQQIDFITNAWVKA